MFGDQPEDENFEDLKFGDECLGCKFRNRPRICRGCDIGELFEERDPDGVDTLFRG